MEVEEEFLRLLDDAIQWLKTGFREREPAVMEAGDGAKRRPAGEKLQVATKAPAVQARPGIIPSDNGRGGMEKRAGDMKDTQVIRGRMREVEEEIWACSKCHLHAGRQKAVPGEGKIDADIMFIGEGPGVQEDLEGRPFVGRAGQLLTRMLAAIQLRREEVYITNIVKCRPPENRVPLPDEVATCFPYLERQIDVIRPLIIVCLGGPAIQALIKTGLGITKLRGSFHRYRDIPVLATYHPAAVLRFPDRYKRDVWNDLKLLRDFYKDIKSIDNGP